MRLVAANNDLLTVLAKTIETRDPYTSGHSSRVAALATVLAQAAGLSLRQIDIVETAARLHDVGKIDPAFASVIGKPFALTAEEHELIKRHSTVGADLLSSLATVKQEVILAVRHHHERYDGLGYPAGLSGQDIPIAARIIMMADSIDAMLSDRPYRNALSVEEVREELLRCSGSQFDPGLVSRVISNDTLERAAKLATEAAREAPIRRPAEVVLGAVGT
jgi:CRISPR-associated endonuclease Cas3-HD